MKIAIEDNFEDVLIKAAVGLRLGHSELAVRSNVSLKEVRALVDGDFEEQALRKLAPVLALNADALVSMAKGAWSPDAIELEGLKCFNTPFPAAGYPGASVNNFVVFDSNSKKAIIFDTGVTADRMLDWIRDSGLEVEALFLTHTHRDHVAAFAKILDVTGCKLSYCPELEPYSDAQFVSHGDRFKFGCLQIEARLTNGHSEGGITYVIQGLSHQVAIVGDSLFCLSMGGAKQAYKTALKNNREQILSLSEGTILCPGHGPLSTVSNEWKYNPFFC